MIIEYYQATIETLLGPMCAIADNTALYFSGQLTQFKTLIRRLWWRFRS